jgi:membrane protein DedA with SNARE-associated domain
MTTAELPHILANAQLAYELHPVRSYLLMYFGTILVGNPVVLGAAWLAWLGKFGTEGILLTLAVCFAAHMSGDQLWYWLGRFGATTRLGKWIDARIKRNERFDLFLERHRVLITATIKLLMLPAIPLLFVAGFNKLDYTRYNRVSVLSTLIWFPILLGFGYGLLSGAVALSSGSILLTLTFLIIFIVATLFAIRYLVLPRIQKYWED